MQQSRAAKPDAVLLAGVAIAAATGLAYEILLLRVFSFSQWHHFASLAVSLALLGFGAAGTCLTLLGERVNRWGDRLFVAGLIIGGLGMVVAFLLPHIVHVRPLFAVWNSSELLKLLLLDFVSFVPFFGLALCIGQVFMRFPVHTSRLYAADLLGSGLGSLGATLLLTYLFLEQALLLLPILAFATAGLLGLSRARLPITGWLALGAALALGGWLGSGPPQLPLSDFKRLAYLLDLPDAHVLETEPGLRNQVTVVRSASIRQAAGLSLQWTDSVPAQDALVLGCDRVLPLPRTDRAGATDYLHATLAAAAFELRGQGQLAVLGSGPTLPLFQAPGRATYWVEANQAIVRAYTARYPLTHVQIQRLPARHFLAASRERFTLIFFAGTGQAGDATGEAYRLTREGLRAALARLAAGGVLAIPTPLNNPPRYTPKLLAMAANGLRGEGIADPWRHTAFLRSLDSGLLLLSNAPLSAADTATLRRFASQWGFDLAALPGLQASEANRFHALAEPLYYRTARALLADDGSLPSASAWYSQRPATDSRPYVWQSMQWQNLPALLEQLGRQGLIWLDWSLLVTAAKLVTAAALAALLILLPQGKLPRGQWPLTRWRVLAYFTTLGLGYLLLEMAAFQRAILYLGHPVPSASLVFAVFLIGSGLGSLSAPSQAQASKANAVFGPILGLATLGFLILHVAAPLLLTLAPWLSAVVIGLLLLPLAMALGRALPWGLRQLDQTRPLIPWAWGINGFASVLAGPIAVLLSVHVSQVSTVAAAILCYATAWAFALSWTRRRGVHIDTAVQPRSN